MCGIYGIWNYRTSAPVDRDLLRRATDSLRHRGPDDTGYYLDDEAGLGLGFRRLSIIDLSDAGHQPMGNEDGSVWIVCNGEIYDFQDLRAGLETAGYTFRSKTDTEVALHLYEQRGAGFIRELNGMFALAIWDRPHRRLLLARDRVGKKPLYYLDDGRRLVFGSELKAILADPSIARSLDYAGFGEYLTLGSVVSPRTILTGVNKLSPGHMLTHESGGASIERYWDWLPAFQRPERSRTEAEWVERIRVDLQGAVRRRMVSDVPLGAFLSGGVDSSAVVATMASLSSRPVRTFSIGFPHARYDELAYARLVSERFGTDHHEFIVQPEALQEIVPRLALQYDEPFGDPSALPTFYVSRLAREHVTVCLSGDGGDEACAGYNRYIQALRESAADRIPARVRRLVFAPARLLPSGVPGRRRARWLSLDAHGRYVDSLRQIPPDLLRSLLSPGASRLINGDGAAPVFAALNEAHSLDFLSRMQYADGRVYLPEDILVKVDRASMLNSLEVRCPLLDFTFLELMASVPWSLRANGSEGKRLFKKALRGLLPDDVLDRPKMGFGVPLEVWLRGDLLGFVREILLDRRSVERGILSRANVEKLIAAHASGLVSLTPALWAILVFEVWCRAYLDAA